MSDLFPLLIFGHSPKPEVSEKTDGVALLISFFRAIGCSKNFPMQAELLPSIVKYATGDNEKILSATTAGSNKAVVVMKPRAADEKQKKKRKKEEKKSKKKRRESLEVARDELQDELKVTPLLFVRVSCYPTMLPFFNRLIGIRSQLLSLELLRRAATPLRTSDERELVLCNDIAMGCLKGNQFIEVEIKGVV